jgi:two-component system response regulator LytT
MSELRIGIVEDDFLIADSIREALQKIGYKVVFSAPSYESAIQSLSKEMVDFVLIDINLSAEKDGVDVAYWIKENKDLPFLFLTANSDKATVDRAKLTKPLGYLVKPFDENSLYSAIEVALENFNQTKLSENNLPLRFKDFIFVKKEDSFIKVEVKDIVYVQSDNVYLTIVTSTNSYLVRTKMDDFLSELKPELFVRIHRSYAVNLDFVFGLQADCVKIKHSVKEIPIQKPYRQKLF